MSYTIMAKAACAQVSFSNRTKQLSKRRYAVYIYNGTGYSSGTSPFTILLGPILAIYYWDLQLQGALSSSSVLPRKRVTLL
jgi:hypothetical protein